MEPIIFIDRVVHQMGTKKGTETVPFGAAKVKIVCIGASGRSGEKAGGRGGYAETTLDVEEGDKFLFKVGDYSLIGPCAGGRTRGGTHSLGGGGSVVAKVTPTGSEIVCVGGGGGGGGGGIFGDNTGVVNGIFGGRGGLHPDGSGGDGYIELPNDVIVGRGGGLGIGGEGGEASELGISGGGKGMDLNLINGFTDTDAGNGGDSGIINMRDVDSGAGGGGYGGGGGGAYGPLIDEGETIYFYGGGGAGGSYGDHTEIWTSSKLELYNLEDAAAVVFEYYLTDIKPLIDVEVIEEETEVIEEDETE